MPYLVRIGAIATNASGVGARGYAVFRSGKRVRVLWGKVIASGSLHTRFRWATEPSSRVHPTCRTEGAARFLARRIVETMQRPTVKGGYSLLPSGVRIYSHRRELP
jgi:L-amino acid N-acyltransferase YncA